MTPWFRTEGLIHPKDRMYWDLFVTFVIVLCAFEIPYGLLVGYGGIEELELIFDWIFFAIFGFDIWLNLRTIRTEDYGGLWGWRTIAGLFS